MAVLDPVVGPATDLLFVFTAEVSHGGTVGSEPVRCDRSRRSMAAKCLLHEGESCHFIAGFGDVALEYFALVIDRTPEIDHIAVQIDVHLVEMPTPVSDASHGLNPLASDVGGEHRPEPVPP